MYLDYVVLLIPTSGSRLGTYHRSIRESQRVKGLRSNLRPKELNQSPYLIFSSFSHCPGALT